MSNLLGTQLLVLALIFDFPRVGRSSTKPLQEELLYHTTVKKIWEVHADKQKLLDFTAAPALLYCLGRHRSSFWGARPPQDDMTTLPGETVTDA